ncbi:MAG: ZIP family metal transporter [Anaerolineae bacterium]|nr:ZIP family metal transporter [Anaerolineae bacterium]
MVQINVWTVFLAALITALATGLGAIPLLFVKGIGHRWLGIANAVAAGLMLGASHGLITEGMRHSLARALAGMVIGMLFMVVTHKILEGREDLQVGALQGAGALKAFMILGAMTLHSFSEGVGVGVSYGGGQALGEVITVAIAVHNIPEGLAISLVMVPRGISVGRAGLWSIFSSLPQPLMAVPAFLFVTLFRPVLPVGLGFAAGAMIWMVFAELMPDAFEDTSGNAIAIAVTASIMAMLLFQKLLT